MILTGEQCTNVTIHWSYDTYMLARSTASQVTKLGGNKWFFVTADYVFGQQLARDAIRFAKEGGGQVLGEQRYPFPSTTDFSSFLLAAQSSGCQRHRVRQRGDRHLQLHQAGARVRPDAEHEDRGAALWRSRTWRRSARRSAPGCIVSASFYWDRDEGTRALTKAVEGAMPGREPPNMIQAGCYASALHYHEGGDRHGGGQGAGRGGGVRADEGDADRGRGVRQELHPQGRLGPAAGLPLPGEEHGGEPQPVDLQKLVATTPADQAWKPLAEEGCALAPA